MGIPCLRDKSEKKIYYELFQENLKKNLEKNYQYNKEYSLVRKKFTQSRIEYEFIENINFTWISYILYKLNENNNNNLTQNWKNLLIIEIQKKNFFEQYKYQNELLFQEILLNKPKNQKNKKEEHFLKGEPIVFPFDVEELRTYSGDNNSWMTNKMFKDNSNFSFNTSMRDDDNQELLYSYTINFDDNENEVSKKDLEFISKYQSYILKKYIKIIRKHIEKEEHPIHIIIDLFIKYFENYLKLIIDFCKNNKNDEKLCYNKGLEAVNEIQNFIEIMQVALKLFYSKSINFKNFSIEKDEIINLISYILFNKKNFYNLVLLLFSEMNAKKMEKFELKLKSNENITPREIGIKPKFCLDKESEEFWEDYKNKRKDSDKNSSTEENTSKKKEELKHYIDNSKSELLSELEKDDQDIISDNKSIIGRKTVNMQKNIIWNNNESFNDSINNNDLDKTFDLKASSINIKEKLLNNLNDIILPKLPEIPNINEIIIKDEPYSLAIKYLRQIYSYKVPLEKLIIISYLSILITQSVENYWSNINEDIPSNFLNLDADEIMSIYLYIIYKLDSSSILAHLEIIKHFTTNYTKQTVLGYYYSTFEGCLRYILQGDEIEIST